MLALNYIFTITNLFKSPKKIIYKNFKEDSMIKDKNVYILLFLGILSTLAFFTTYLEPVLFISYGFLFYILFKTSSFKKSLVYGFIFGFSHLLSGIFWLFSILEIYSGIEKIISLFIIMGIVSILSLEWSLFALINYLTKKISTNSFSQIVLIMPSLATIVDWFRSWFITGFTWLSPADILFDFGFGFLLPITGSLGVNYLFYVLVSIVVYMVVSKKYKLSFALLFIIAFLIFIGNVSLQKFTKPINNSLYTQIIQTNKTKKEKQQRYKVIDSIHSYQLLSQQKPFSELSVWPESTMSLSCQIVKKNTKDGFDAIRQNKTEVLYGSYEQLDKQTYNSIMSNSNNKIVYTKQHLIPFGEYIPKWMLAFEEFIPSMFMNDISTNQANKLIVIKGITLSPSICYEILFGDELRRKNGEANILVHISDLGWFNNIMAKNYLLNVARVRAQEVQKPMIYVVNFGNSAFISPYGQIESVAKQNTGTYAMYKNIIPFVGQTPYAKYGSTPLLVWVFILLAISLIFNFILKQRRFT